MKQYVYISTYSHVRYNIEGLNIENQNPDMGQEQK